MDPQNPFRSLAPSVEGDVLGVLARTRAPLTGARVAELAGRSATQVRAVLRDLEHHGLVHSERRGQAYSYVLNRGHVLADAVELVSGAADRFERGVGEAIAAWTVEPAAAALFGSFARRDGDADSDVDVLLVRPRGVSEEDDVWQEQRHRLATSIEAWTGNRAQVLDIDEDDLAEAVRREEPLVANLREEAVAVFADLGRYLGTATRALR